MNRRNLAFATAALIILIGCTITTKHQIEAHITLDIRFIEEQADELLDFIEGATEGLPGEETATSEMSTLRKVWECLAPMRTAYAQADSLSARAKQIAQKMKERHPKLEALKKPGCAGENNRGYVELRKCDALDTPEKKNEAQKLIAAENADRKALYQEIARQDKEGKVTVSTVERVHAQRRLERAKPVERFQLPSDGDHFKAFAASALGKKLAAQCKPNAWVKIK